MTNLIGILSNFRWLILAAAILKWMSFHVWVLNEWFGVDLSMAIWDSAITNVVIVGASAELIITLKHYIPTTGKFWFALGISFFLSLLCQWLIHQGLLQVAGSNSEYLLYLHQAQPLRWSVLFLVIAGTSIASVFYFQLQAHEHTTDHATSAATMLREAELHKLQMQLQPHFLFNCLNSINALILVRPDEAKMMVQHLSDFLRITLKRADEQWVNFAEEWVYLQRYLDIEKIRFGHRLEVETDFTEESYDWKIPTLLLQPLVENAIKFGLYGTTEKVNIRIRAWVKENMLNVLVSNPFDPESQPPGGSGFGLRGLERRLYLLFARNDLLETKSSDNVFAVTLKIPRYHDQRIAD